MYTVYPHCMRYCVYSGDGVGMGTEPVGMGTDTMGMDWVMGTNMGKN